MNGLMRIEKIGIQNQFDFYLEFSYFKHKEY